MAIGIAKTSPIMLPTILSNLDIGPLVKSVVNFAKLNDNSLTRAEAYEIARDGLRKKPTGNLTQKSVAYSAEGLSEDDMLVQQIIDLNSGQND